MEEKRNGHVESEKKRRANIKAGFKRVVDLVPNLTGGNRSEAVILEKSTFALIVAIDYIHAIEEEQRVLIYEIQALSEQLGEPIPLEYQALFEKFNSSNLYQQP